ncbi:MAG: MFS transporter [Candidatus Heimdallarchaeota archaeon]|nr:MFS transporter [Candidatus Heimdallarchaeota archaeon]MCK4612098.1 MFS transporter [Candidatus Heimdallarchaeota archaeon]
MSNVEVVIDKNDIKETDLESKKTSTKNAWLWYSYDMADTFFSQSVISLAFTPFVLLMGVKMGWRFPTVFIVMSAFMAGSNLLIAIFGPILGAISDKVGKRKPAVLISAGIMVTTTALITVWSNFWWACILFVIANFCYQAGRMFYDAQIPFIAETEKRGFTQAIGGALAAFGSVIAIAISIIIGLPSLFGAHTHVDTGIWQVGGVAIDPNTINYGGLKYLFLISAIVIILISIPYFFHKEVENPPEEKMSPKEHVKSSLIAFKTSLKAIISDRNSWLFFLAWFFITDAANTTILYMVPVVSAMGGPALEGMTNYIILGGIIFSIIFGILVGRLMNRLGPKKLLLAVAISWFIAIVIFVLSGLQIGSVTIPSWLIWFGAVFIGVGFGGIWIVGRQFIMVLAPPSKLAQYGGFQKIAGRVSAIVSPLLFGLVIFLTDDLVAPPGPMRIALASLLVLFSIGIIFTLFIRDPHKRYMKGERAPYKGIYDKE